MQLTVAPPKSSTGIYLRSSIKCRFLQDFRSFDWTNAANRAWDRRARRRRRDHPHQCDVEKRWGIPRRHGSPDRKTRLAAIPDRREARRKQDATARGANREDRGWACAHPARGPLARSLPPRGARVSKRLSRRSGHALSQLLEWGGGFFRTQDWVMCAGDIRINSSPFGFNTTRWPG